MNIAALLRTAKPSTLLLLSLVTLAGATCSSGFLSSPSGTASLSGAAVAVLIVALVWSATAILNDCYDVEIDRVSNPSRAVVRGLLRRDEALRAAVLLYALAMMAMLTLRGTASKGVVMLGIILGVQYSAPPLRLRRWGVAGMLVIGSGVALAFLLGSLSQGSISTEALVTAFLFGIFAFNAAILKDFKDLEGDRKAGVVTLPVLLGYRRAAALALLGVGLSYAMLIAHTPGFTRALLLLIAIPHLYGILGLYRGCEAPFKAYALTKVCGICVVLTFILGEITGG